MLEKQEQCSWSGMDGLNGGALRRHSQKRDRRPVTERGKDLGLSLRCSALGDSCAERQHDLVLFFSIIHLSGPHLVELL
jgi:hypothetical protein